jgi:hypothetical protein
MTRSEPTKKSDEKGPFSATASGPLERSDYLSCLLATVAPWVGVLLVCLKIFGPIPFTKEQESDLTDGGRFWIHFERDIPLYVSAIVMLLLLVMAIPWQKCSKGTHPKITRSLALSGVFVFLAPLCLWISPLSGATAPWTITAVFAFLAAGVSLPYIAIVSRREASSAVEQRLNSNPLRIEKPKLGRWDIGVLSFIAFLILIPCPEYLAGRFFQIEELNHWNAFVMSAALAFKHGAALYKDFTPIYGAGWPSLLGYLSTFIGLKYSHVIMFSMVFSILYFFGLYYLFRFFFTGRLTPFAFALLATVMTVFPSGEPETKSLVWRWSGGAQMRCPTDLPFLILLAKFCISQNRRTAILLGISLGCSFLFAVDVGIFLFTTALVTWFFLLCQSFTKSRVIDCICSFGAVIFSCFLGLLVASRGTVMQAETRKNIFEYVQRATGGEGMIPFADLKPFWVILFALIILMLLILAAEFFKRCRTSLATTDVFLITASLYPLQRIVYFMGRTHWGVLVAIVVPALIGSVVLLKATLLQQPSGLQGEREGEGKPTRLESRFGWAAMVGAALFFAFSKDTPNYPALWNMRVLRELETHTPAIRPKERDILGLDDQYSDYASSFRAVASRVRQLHDAGLKVRFLDACSTTLYVTADIPPFGRDVFELDRADTSKKEIEKLVSHLALAEADVLVINRARFPWPRLLSLQASQACRDAMFSFYRMKEVSGPFEIWYRNGVEKL